MFDFLFYPLATRSWITYTFVLYLPFAAVSFRIVRYPLSINFFLMLPESVLAHAEILADFAHRGEACVPGSDACGKVRIDRLRLDRQLPVTHHTSRNSSIPHRKYINHLCCLVHHSPCFPFVCFDRTADTMKVNRYLGLYLQRRYRD